MYLAQGITGIQSPSTVFQNYNTIWGDLLGRFLLFAIPAAGLFFFARIIQAGYTIMTTSGDPAKLQAANTLLSNSAIGLVIVISSFFIAQIAEVILGIKIL